MNQPPLNCPQSHTCTKQTCHSPAGARTPVPAVVEGTGGHVLQAGVEFILAPRFTLALVKDDGDGEDEEEGEGDGGSNAGPHIVGRVEFLEEKKEEVEKRGGREREWEKGE